jgi:hypothetical protein
MGDDRADLETLYELHTVLADRLAAGHYPARGPLKVIAEMIVERERRIAEEVLDSGDDLGEAMARESPEAPQEP